MVSSKVVLKVGNMRKPQEFTVYSYDMYSDFIIVQSSKRIGALHKRTGEFRISPNNVSNPYFPALDYAVPVPITAEDQEKIRRAYVAKNNGQSGMVRIL